ncbi:MAG TPA: 50S ribosomal protein L25 [Candidatus Binatia bacterium]|jgi:large subunit ribosomal protein L25
MRSIELSVESRAVGESPRRLRRAGAIPGVLYGAGTANVCVKVDAHEFSKSGLSGHGAHLIKLKSVEAALDQGLALIQDIQGHPVSGAPIHVDFLRVDANTPVTAAVAISFTGKAKGVVGEGGILQPVRREIEVRALPGNLPEHIDIDVTELGIHDSVHIADVALPEGVEAIYQDNFTIVSVLPPTKEAAEGAPTAETTEAAAAAPAAGAATPAAS